MATVVGEHGTGESEDKSEVKFVDSLDTLGVKLLVHGNHRFHRKGGTNKVTHYRCKYGKKWGCPATVTLYNFDPLEYTFDSFVIGKREHRWHPPDVENCNRESVMETLDALDTCRHICLFCFANLSPDYWKDTVLENVVPYKNTLTTSLNDPVKNSQAFEFLCNRLGIRWRKSKEGQNFDQTGILPLCLKCQWLYQEMFQLHLQVRQLEKLIGDHVAAIKNKIERAEQCSNSELVVGGTQLTIFGLDVFRQKVVNLGGLLRASDNMTENVEEPTQPPEMKATVVMGNSGNTVATKKEFCSISEDIPTLDDLIDSVKQEMITQPELTFDDENSNIGDLLWTNSPAIPNNSKATEDLDLEDNFSIGSDNANAAAAQLSGSDSETEEEVIRKAPTRSTRLAARKARQEKQDHSKDDGDDYIPSEENNSEEENNDADDHDDKDYDNDFDVDNSDDSDYEVKKSHKKRENSKTRTNPATSTSRSLRKVGKHAWRSAYRPQKEYTCHICSSKELGYTAFLAHYNNHHPEENRYTCKFCKRHFEGLRDCVVHQRRHTGERPFQCSLCSSAFTSKKALTSHTFYNHTDRADLTFPCPTCKKEFQSRSTLHNHRLSVHGYAPKKRNRKLATPMRSWACHICDKVISGRAAFIQHYVETHPDEKRFSCKFCQRHFPDHRDCVRHQRKHTGERPFPCPSCDKAFRDNKTLRGHQRIYHSESSRVPHICPECGKQYPTKSALTGHMNVHNECIVFCKTCGFGFKNLSSFCKHNRRIHSGKAEHTERITELTADNLASLGMEIRNRSKCHVCWAPVLGKLFMQKHFEDHHPNHQGGVNTCKCGKKFTHYKDCMKHAIRHSTHKTYQCDQCPQTFFTSTELRLHSIRHAPLEERKCNVCDICGIKLVSHGALAKHKKKHEENQMRWVCEECGKDYAEKKGLNHHKRTEHLRILPFKCPHETCARAFALNADLVKHMRSHSGVKPFKCPHCDKCFPYTSSKARHIREVHRIGDEVKKSWSRPRRKRGKNLNLTALDAKVTEKELEKEMPSSSSTALATTGNHQHHPLAVAAEYSRLLGNYSSQQLPQYSMGAILATRDPLLDDSGDIKSEHSEHNS